MLKTKLQSYLDVVDLMAKAFSQYLESMDKSYKVTIEYLTSNDKLNAQDKNVLLIYKLYKRQQGSQKRPFQEKTFLQPIPVNLQVGATGITQSETYKFFLDNMIEFKLYSTDYLLTAKAQEDFIEYMSLLSIGKNVFSENGIRIPVFWEQKEDEVIELGGTKLYVATLHYQVQTKQEISRTIDVIRKINTYVEMIS